MSEPWKSGDRVLIDDHRAIHRGAVCELVDRHIGRIAGRPYWTLRLPNGATTSEFEDSLRRAQPLLERWIFEEDAPDEYMALPRRRPNPREAADGQANTSSLVGVEHIWRIGDRARLKSWPRDFYRFRPGVTLKGGDEIMVLAVEEPVDLLYNPTFLVFIHPKAEKPLKISLNEVDFSWRPEPIHIPTLIERQAKLWEKSRRIQAERGLLADVLERNPEIDPAERRKK